jgi:hypothetical protein
MHILLPSLGATLLLLHGAGAQEPGDESATFEEVREHVLPSDDELAWQRLGWRASLWEGVIDAQALEKPIVLWAMNGHPLGCT